MKSVVPLVPFLHARSATIGLTTIPTYVTIKTNKRAGRQEDKKAGRRGEAIVSDPTTHVPTTQYQNQTGSYKNKSKRNETKRSETKQIENKSKTNRPDPTR
mmetsp:Transcript_8871/g.26330  ORF Transcript_8871/g.26330 Transcript_8871/m.26330 type:complete len:101 (-) Transcript_8871:213-515(-)